MNETQKPIISVVLPTHNACRYLTEAVESVLAQTYSNLELIIVDDASTDETPETIARLIANDRRIRTIRHDMNRKVPAALNTGFAASQGEYLTWTSDDNRYRPTALQDMLAALQENPMVGLVYADFSQFGDDGRLIDHIRVQPPERLTFGNPVGACFLYRRTVYETVGDYDASFFLAEDYEYWVRVAKIFRLMPLHKDLYLYRIHTRSLSFQMSEARRAVHEHVLLRHLPDMTWADSADRANGYRLLAEMALTHSRYAAAAKNLLIATRLSPIQALKWSLRKTVKKTKMARR